MVNQRVISEQALESIPTHRAFYYAVSKQRWSVYQKRVLQFWKSEKALKSRQVFTKRYYIPLIQPWIKNLDDKSQILEIGSGPVCAAQYLGKGEHTYVDPLMDDYRRLFPGVMPEGAHYLAAMAEKLELPEKSFDMALCLNTLSDVHNPELVMSKVHDVLKDDGLFVVSMDLWPLWLARAHFWLSRFAPVFPGLNRLYSYTARGFRNTLLRHFEIQEEIFVRPRLYWLSLKREVLFVCKPKRGNRL